MRSKILNPNLPKKEQLETLLDRNAAAICQGNYESVRCAHWLLNAAGIVHEVCFGYAILYYENDQYGDSELVRPHWWIKCENLIIDYCLKFQLSLGGQLQSSGVFEADPKRIRYISYDLPLQQKALL